jgi:hypothetical protein
MSIYAPKYPNMSIRDLYDRALGCDMTAVNLMIDEIIDEVDYSTDIDALSVESNRLRREVRLGLIAAGLI